MVKQNNIVVGILIGAIFPALSWVIFGYLHPEAVWMNKPAIPYLIAVAINLLLIRWSHRSNYDKLSRGIMVSTFAFLVFIFLLKVKL